jgi:hypothetical protein
MLFSDGIAVDKARRVAATTGPPGHPPVPAVRTSQISRIKGVGSEKISG